jgi:DNA-binding response OmpR family regulator
MERQIVLIVEAERPEGVSARKLILESLQHHVMIAYTAKEAMEMLRRVQIDVILIHTSLYGTDCQQLAADVRRHNPGITILALSPGGVQNCGSVTTLDSLRPDQLVRYFTSLS